MTTPPISYDKNQSLDLLDHLLAGIRFPNQLQLDHLKPGYQDHSTVGSSALHPQLQREE